MIGREVADDLKEIKERDDPVVAVRIATLLREARNDPDLADRLLQFGDHSDSRTGLDFNVDQFVALQKQGLDVYRIKILDLERSGLQYRIIYGYFEESRTIVALAAVHRSFDYATSHPVTQRAISSYERLRDAGWR